MLTISSKKDWVYETWQKWIVNSYSFWHMATRCCGFHEGLFLKVSSLAAIVQKLWMRARKQLIGYDINLLNKVWQYTHICRCLLAIHQHIYLPYLWRQRYIESDHIYIYRERERESERERSMWLATSCYSHSFTIATQGLSLVEFPSQGAHFYQIVLVIYGYF